MMIMKWKHFLSLFISLLHKSNREQNSSSHSFTSTGTQPFDPEALESKLFLIGLNRLTVDRALKSANFTPVKVSTIGN